MSIATSLRRAAKLQQKIEGLRGQLSSLLAKARSEVTSEPVTEISSIFRKAGRKPGRPKLVQPALAATRGRQAKKVDGRTKQGRVMRARGRSPLAGRKRAASPTGPLAPAVVKVLRSKNKPMNVRDILAELLSGGYEFNSPEPKKNLAARIYRLKGVKQVGEGLFATA